MGWKDSAPIMGKNQIIENGYIYINLVSRSKYPIVKLNCRMTHKIITNEKIKFEDIEEYCCFSFGKLSQSKYLTTKLNCGLTHKIVTNGKISFF